MLAPCELPTIGGLLRSPRTSHEDSARRQVWCLPLARQHTDKLCQPVGAKPAGPYSSRCFPHCGVRFAHLNTHPALACLLVLHALLMPFDQPNPLDLSPYLVNRALHHITTPHNTPHPIHTARSYFNVSFRACPHPHSPSPQLTRASSHMF